MRSCQKCRSMRLAVSPGSHLACLGVRERSFDLFFPKEASIRKDCSDACFGIVATVFMLMVWVCAQVSGHEMRGRLGSLLKCYLFFPPRCGFEASTETLPCFICSSNRQDAGLATQLCFADSTCLSRTKFDVCFCIFSLSTLTGNCVGKVQPLSRVQLWATSPRLHRNLVRAILGLRTF